MKIGLFFGSFNPIHIGHLIIANTMAEHTDLDQVWLVVSPQNPFKKNNSLLHEFDRFEMARLATMESYKIKVSDVEFHLPRPSYTIDTLKHLKNSHPGDDFVLILGEDNLTQFERWKAYEEILDNYYIYAYARPEAAKTEFHHHHKIKFIDAPLLDISATYIRKCVKENKSIRYLVTPEVEDYILQKRFFS